ncbi:putative inhibitor of apoptosis [Phlebotomus argentipes]|uniref:putative inhibitor of apoptosis n=1 Tax=Phlebotomus argentipes TaxID=94469 RepID=UPI0028932AA1|nr:putative inhibitor of apoptosis [Phlebotomus argentipes]
MSVISSAVDGVGSVRPLSADMCGFDRPRDPYKIYKHIYRRQASREATFKNWPQQLNPSPKELVEAGFIYKDRNDIVKCISCKVRLGGWQPDDDPWVEHAKANASCEYLIHHKGENFAQEALEQQNPSADAEDDQPSAHLDAPVGICKLCGEEKSNIMFIPCGHIVTCANCSTKVKKCFYCNHRVDKYQRVYL